MNRVNLIAMLLVIACGASSAENPHFEKDFLFGVHRGGAKWRPEHTVETYKAVRERWPNALLEMDVRLTKDGHVVLHHDGSVDRTTDGSGPVEEMTLEEVKALDAGYKFSSDDGETFPYRGKGLQIATLDEALTEFPDARWLIEPKTDGPLVAAIAKIVKRHDAEERIILASFKPAVLEEAKALLPDAVTCFTMKTGMMLFGALRAGDDAWANYKPADDILSLSKGMLKQFNISAEEIAMVKTKGIKVQLHTLNSEDEIRRGIELGVDSILSDRPDVLAKVLADR